MRLAVFTYGLPVVGQKRGGIERVAHELADGLARRGHEVTVWSHDPRPDGAAYEVRMLPWQRFVTSWLGRRLTMGYLGNILATLPDYGPYDAIIAHGDSLLLGMTRRRVVRIMHGSALAEAMSARTPWRCLMQLGVYAQELLTALVCRPVVAVSANSCRHNPLVRQVIANGVDLRVFGPTPAGKTPQPSILFVGALTGRKRGQLLLDWFTNDIRPQFPNATLDLVGAPGPEAPGVNYHCGVDDAELADLYRRAWVYASPSSYEGFGLPYLEAMACGTPVVATPNPGSREVLDNGRYGILASDADFVPELARLLIDEPRRHALAQAGLARALELSLDSMIDRYEALLNRLAPSPVLCREAR